MAIRECRALCNVDFEPQTLHELGADVDAMDENGYTAMMGASFKGDIDMVKLLHQLKADLDVCSQAGIAMHLAVEGGHVDMIKVSCSA